VILAMAVLPDTRSQFFLSLVTVAVLLVAYQLRSDRVDRPVDRPADRTRQ
jgi:hypothetical protein